MKDGEMDLRMVAVIRGDTYIHNAIPNAVGLLGLTTDSHVYLANACRDSSMPFRS
jgi:hypothetical protein